jgi:hypothetical protein
MLETLSAFGKKSAAYIGIGAIEATFGFVLALKSPGSLAGFAGVLTAINVPLYGGGILAKWAERDNGNVA